MLLSRVHFAKKTTIFCLGRVAAEELRIEELRRLIGNWDYFSYFSMKINVVGTH